MLFTVTITDKAGVTSVREFDQPEVTIGRIQGNDIVLPKNNISKRHARIINNDGSFVVVDSKSTNGTYLNGQRLEAPQDIKLKDKIFVGDFTLEVQVGSARELGLGGPTARRTPPRPPGDDDIHRPTMADPQQMVSDDDILGDDAWGTGGNLNEEWDNSWGDDDFEESAPNDRALGGQTEKRTSKPSDAEAALAELQRELEQPSRSRSVTPPPPPSVEAAPRRRRSTRTGAGRAQASRKRNSVSAPPMDWGPLANLMQDDSVTSIIVNHSKQILVQRADKLEKTTETFSGDASLASLVKRLGGTVGLHVGDDASVVDAHLKDGSHVHAVFPPMAVFGSSMIIRKAPPVAFGLRDWVQGGCLTEPMAKFLEVCMEARRNILVSGGPSSGKTSLLDAICTRIDAEERIVVVEDTAELTFDQPHVLRLAAHGPDEDTQREVPQTTLIRSALRMRPDRLVVGDCKGAEVLDLLEAMTTGRDGTLCAVHAHGSFDAMARLETLAMLGGKTLHVRAARALVASAIDVVVHVSLFAHGARVVTQISEVLGVEGEQTAIQDIFRFDTDGFDANKHIKGKHRPTGAVPRFCERRRDQGFDTDFNIFHR